MGREIKMYIIKNLSWLNGECIWNIEIGAYFQNSKENLWSNVKACFVVCLKMMDNKDNLQKQWVYWKWEY